MNDFNTLAEAIRAFNKERDWDQFHNGKDLAIALSIEAGELLEAFLWKSPADVKKEKLEEELADVFIFAIQIADKYNIDIMDIVLNKVRKNSEKYPVEKAKGTARKYNEF